DLKPSLSDYKLPLSLRTGVTELCSQDAFVSRMRNRKRAFLKKHPNLARWKTHKEPVLKLGRINIRKEIHLCLIMILLI
ncbi:hypothetical protein, partial [Acinetobacter baumannii]|uniref:hypothetical protein n=1 Tax=Acinetobacter baumannii TaxID=470 RepID=UPI001969AF71